jgi:xanthine dehydrogenase YagT iron-sulfur-binding subunit
MRETNTVGNRQRPKFYFTSDSDPERKTMYLNPSDGLSSSREAPHDTDGGAAVLDPPAASDYEQAAIGPAPASLSLNVNGADYTVYVDPATTLAEVLRQHLGLTGTKIGCERGACSACTVWLDGEVAASCMTFALDARGRRITTIEGLADDRELHAVQRSFIEHDAMQCGFCTPGMVMSCAALIEHNPSPSMTEVKRAISGHLCRCGTYNNIFRAMQSLGARAEGEAPNA